LTTLEKQGFRPRIQDAWRSPEDQLKAFNAGFSKLKFGFHNVTGVGARKESLACDVLDDDHPEAPPTRFLLALALAARAQGLTTGVLWGLPNELVTGVEAALAAKNIDARVSVGWDPTHTQVTGITPTQAKSGARPSGAAAARSAIAAPAPGAGQGKKEHIVVSGDTLTKIARDAGITLARLLELNPKFRPNPNLIHIGDPVRLA
jgi:LysM repeat protein